jgi:hypothetical protein
MCRCPRTGEGVEYDGVPVRGDLEDALDELDRLGRSKVFDINAIHDAI